MVLVALLAAMVAIPVTAVVGSVDAFGYSRDVWVAAGYRRSIWLWQAVGALCPPLALLYSGTYLVRVRPRLMRAQRELLRRRWAGFASLAADDSQGKGSEDAAVRIRVSWQVAASTLLPLVILGAGISLRPSSWTDRLLAALIIVIVAGGSIALQRWFGITLTPTHAVVHAFRRQQLAWDHIVEVTQERYLGTSRVVLWTSDGRHRPLRAPTMPWPGIGRHRFDHDLDTITRWWLSHRGRSPQAD